MDTGEGQGLAPLPAVLMQTSQLLSASCVWSLSTSKKGMWLIDRDWAQTALRQQSDM